ncbi:MAG: sigma-70 family RNA polymerase sigma factor [Oscillospiraceae bacterium]|jgi:RNA polymerase sigma-70 factor (ECF subfamily)|nr:sigma-70 family RNA polymerase sigma factor [Oscillospiraceae bacterium]
MDDSEIIELFRRRSEDALTECGNRFGTYCRTIANNILGNVSDADECVNETWFKAWNAIPPAKPERLKAFLGKITRNIALDRYESARAKKRGGGMVEIALEELADIPAPESDEGEITAVINAFLRSEPAENADIFVKRYWYLRSVKAIAAEYGYNENKVTSLLLRMRGRLKQKLESEGLM